LSFARDEAEKDKEALLFVNKKAKKLRLNVGRAGFNAVPPESRRFRRFLGLSRKHHRFSRHQMTKRKPLARASYILTSGRKTLG
jgi:hypothetical protein